MKGSCIRQKKQQAPGKILEIDTPVDEVSIHRKAFYERAGYKANEFEHIHPPYHEEYPGHRLVVMSYPQQLTKAGYYSFNQYLSAAVMALAIPSHTMYNDVE